YLRRATYGLTLFPHKLTIGRCQRDLGASPFTLPHTSPLFWVTRHSPLFCPCAIGQVRILTTRGSVPWQRTLETTDRRTLANRATSGADLAHGDVLMRKTLTAVLLLASA